MKITQVYRTRNGIVGPTSINGYGVIKIDGLRYDKDENKYYDSEDNEVILEEGREYYSNNKLYVYDGKLTELLTDLMIEVKYTELVELRNNGELIPGVKYRIIDYQCTTIQRNTKSAGHQFDIVLLALSENKLAEEGWAMMHDNIYDVTFIDGVTKKCYLYDTGNNEYNIVDVQTLLGIEGSINGQEIIINEDDKTVLMDNNNGYESSNLYIPDLTYNYFQNSKLEAWKVWYCLDNDKSRFAWADEGSVIPGELISVTFGETLSRTGTPTSTIIHKSDGDYIMLTGTGPGVNFYYKQGTTVGDNGVFVGNGNPADPVMGSPSIITSINTTEPTIIPEGKGVIYRLIDEWNNDVPYDFKNIQYKRKVDAVNLPTIGNDVSESFFYTFSIVNKDNYEILDASIFAKKFVNDEQGEGRCYSNFISSIDEYTGNISMSNIYTLPDIVFAKSVMNYDSACLFVNIKCYQSESLTILSDIVNVNFIHVIGVNSNDAYSELGNVTIYNLANRDIDNFALSNKKFISAMGNQLQTINLVNL